MGYDDRILDTSTLRVGDEVLVCGRGPGPRDGLEYLPGRVASIRTDGQITLEDGQRFARSGRQVGWCSPGSRSRRLVRDGGALSGREIQPMPNIYRDERLAEISRDPDSRIRLLTDIIRDLLDAVAVQERRIVALERRADTETEG